MRGSQDEALAVKKSSGWRYLQSSFRRGVRANNYLLVVIVNILCVESEHPVPGENKICVEYPNWIKNMELVVRKSFRLSIVIENQKI